MTDLLYAVLMGLIAYRVWYFIARDFISERPREWVLDRTPDLFGVFVNCPWCLGFWISGALTWVVGTIYIQFTLPMIFVWLATSAVVGIIDARSE